MTSTDIPEWARQLAVFDTETTGIDTRSSRIVTAHVSLITFDGTIVNRRDWLINAGVEIPARATEVHGITTEQMTAEGSDPKESLTDIRDTLGAYFSQGIGVVAYNAAYDFSILDQELKRYSIDTAFIPKPVIDPLVIDRKVDKWRKGKRTLINASQHYGVSLVDAHDASADAIAAGLVARAIAQKYATELDLSATELHDAQISWAREQGESMAEWRAQQGLKNFSNDHSWPVRA